MEFDLMWLAGMVTTALAAATGAYVSARLGFAHAERTEAARSRRDSAERLVATLTAVRTLLRDVQHNRDVEPWAVAVNNAYDEIEDARFRLPQSFRHVQQSVRIALGEAVGGVSLVDLRSSRGQEELSAYNHRWNEYAIEYIDMTMGAVREWRDASAKAAPNVCLLGFDAWLAKTNRYVHGESATD